MNYTKYRIIFVFLAANLTDLSLLFLYLGLGVRILLRYVYKYVVFDYINSIYLAQEWELVVFSVKTGRIFGFCEGWGKVLYIWALLASQKELCYIR
jgi:hypothetical protein